MTVFFASLAAAGVATHFFRKSPKLSFIWCSVFALTRSTRFSLLIYIDGTHIGIMMGGDIIQTGGIVFYLLRHSKNALHHGPTASILGSLLRLTIQSAAPATLCALVTFVTVVSERGTSGLSVQAAVSGFTGLCLPKFHAVAAMWTLNSREEIRVRSVAANEFVTGFELQTTSGGTSNFVRTGMSANQGIRREEPHNCEASKPVDSLRVGICVR
ncbi:hypothetical protein MSAN_01073900 [Mycena sanguinolenta]|uniref:DUF6534 domain-containing protein n=1 Tax=Mycena sanguinolenta TaxID=230812 RepID=A0A8H6YSN4_9AGAR|nr:hypothetical protein MSAN_01073900 [Mycena sanguinolenta]